MGTQASRLEYAADWLLLVQCWSATSAATNIVRVV
jgi:hypothetical protein